MNIIYNRKSTVIAKYGEYSTYLHIILSSKGPNIEITDDKLRGNR